MGQRLAPTLAIAFMSRIEAPVLQCRPLLYCRYIDDCFVICATQAEMDKCFELMNEQSEHIKLTRDTPRNDWLPFLNAQINIAHGICRTKWYRKPSNKNILVHFLSAHPAHAKKAIVTNMFRTATRVCSGLEEKEESLAFAQRVAAMNGYTNQIPRSKRHKGVVRQSRESTHADKIPFCLPFISDEVAGTALLMFFVCVIIDKRIAIPGWVHPFLFGFVVIMIGTSVGMNVGYPINPARDLGPRIFMLFIGYGSQAFTYHDYYFWIPIIAPLVGAVLAAWTYHLFIGCHIPDPKPVVLSMDEAKQLLR
ncbi:hypothetical protein Y032_0068g213 [Ancylostoma ceylanicum]|nr:hypothetical protein Y032_0068g213 [Ancylostoma ceylanicum]